MCTVHAWAWGEAALLTPGCAPSCPGRHVTSTLTHTCTHSAAVPIPACTELSFVASFQNVTEKQKACETDLAKAEPALLAAQEALDTLNKVKEGNERTGTGQGGEKAMEPARGPQGLGGLPGRHGASRSRGRAPSPHSCCLSFVYRTT